MIQSGVCVCVCVCVCVATGKETGHGKASRGWSMVSAKHQPKEQGWVEQLWRPQRLLCKIRDMVWA